MIVIVDLIDEVINNYENEDILKSVKEKVHNLMSHRPLFDS